MALLTGAWAGWGVPLLARPAVRSRGQALKRRQAVGMGQIWARFPRFVVVSEGATAPALLDKPAVAPAAFLGVLAHPAEGTAK